MIKLFILAYCLQLNCKPTATDNTNWRVAVYQNQESAIAAATDIVKTKGESVSFAIVPIDVDLTKSIDTEIIYHEPEINSVDKTIQVPAVPAISEPAVAQ